MTHAFFKALLFLAAGAVIHCLHHEHDIFKMGGVKRRLPAVFWTFLIGSASLAGLPLITAGFYSKDLILWQSWSSNKGSPWLWGVAVLAAFITAFYIFRVVFLVFLGKEHTHAEQSPGMRMHLPLIILSFFAVTAGFMELPHAWGHFQWFSEFMDSSLPAAQASASVHGSELLFGAIAGLIALAGISMAYYFYVLQPARTERLSGNASIAGIRKFLFSGWGFDWLYDKVLVTPFTVIAHLSRKDIIDSIYSGIAASARNTYALLSATETGHVRLYAGGIAVGSILLIAIVVLL